MEFDEETVVPLPIDGILDLHPFAPGDLKTLIPDYLDECIAQGIYEVKIIHGKGTGNIRRSVHALLKRNPKVISFTTAENTDGGWGATILQLKKPGA